MRRLTILVAVGIVWAQTADETFIGARGRYWAFQKVVPPPVPATRDAWVRNPIDAFILQGLRQKHLEPSSPLDRNRLIRRVTLDLTGLPPSASDVDAFLKDKSPGAYEKVVDRLLATPAYGERWGAKWLDVVRYADTNGFELDLERPNAWRYRDYVVRSFNQDKPYDRFVREQIAGDELFPGDKDASWPPAFCAPVRVIWWRETSIDEESRQEVLIEITANVAPPFSA